MRASRGGPNGYTRVVLRYFSSRVAQLLLLALPVASCDGSLRLVVVEEADNGDLSLAGKGGSGGGVSVLPMGGASTDGGSSEAGQGGSAGKPDDAVGAAGAGGVPDVPRWEAAPLYTASFVPYAFPQQYVRYLDGVGVIAPIDMESFSDVDAASFVVFISRAR